MLKAIAFISIGLFFIFSPIQSVQAEQNRKDAPTDILKQVLNSQDFGGNKDTWGVRLKNQQEAKNPRLPNINFSWIEKIKNFFGSMLLVAFSLVIIFAAGYIILRLYMSKKDISGANAIKGKKWKNSFITFSGQEDPEKLLAEAQLLHNQGMFRDAWAKCFLAATAIYSVQSDLDFPLNATEYDCLSIVRKAKASDAEGFKNLVVAWTDLAYGGKLPDSNSFEKAIEFCNSLRFMDTAASHA
ncbi:MAG: hypothetical protein FWD87_10645 [Spirochaetaceae bacterium]|nr:hypothetical protein [Spirochaetaceae bacterium]